MPLTFVIEHLNQQLKTLHPSAALSRHASLEYEQQAVYAQLGELRLTPVQSSVFRIANTQRVASDSHLLVTNSSGRQQPVEVLYLQVWDAEDVIFLDRFLRTLHALHHVNQQHQGATEQLILDVHARHLSAVPSGHGQVFEGLLSSLGLAPAQIILRLNLPTCDDCSGIEQAISSFAARGYSLLAACEHPDLSQLNLLKDLGVQLVSLNLQHLQQQNTDWAQVRKWSKVAGYHDLQTLVEGVATAAELNLLLDLGFQLVSGSLLNSSDLQQLITAGKAGQLFAQNCRLHPEMGLGL
ncbi:EAL domain-containing protein [Marinospirillum alkaliphilum]|uniref:EAL domain, c-di-GMP-specific phosphodiesterase class I (Or its enzymatically inactive variant) n=1 Tax=Marinospirillum alkaliphilum DSM 21637 TaxID=1122209 RepID=A0A1K1TF01_9GAMM|nr:EAL domain-containing protein [Marinospirillum alkaliphilum]SFW99233.1 EAL domain, c-di-GMP-specific phosphodiesterase class I (or its enzymatically inactive variant) [Marinospirillum alkaliphilum DSM 21637]